MPVIANNRWLKKSLLRAVGTMLDTTAGLFAVNTSGLIDVTFAVTITTVVSAGLFCFARSISKLVDGGE